MGKLSEHASPATIRYEPGVTSEEKSSRAVAAICPRGPVGTVFARSTGSPLNTFTTRNSSGAGAGPR